MVTYNCTKKALETFPGNYVILIPVKDDNEKIVLEILNRYNSGKPDKVAGLIAALETIAKSKHPDRSCSLEAQGFDELDCAVIGAVDRLACIAEDALKTHNQQAEYFVLRLDEGGKDLKHIEACRIAVNAYAEVIANHLPELAADLKKRYPLPFKISLYL